MAVAFALRPKHICHQMADVRLEDRQRVPPDGNRNRLNLCALRLQSRGGALQPVQNSGRTDFWIATFLDDADSQPIDTAIPCVTVRRGSDGPAHPLWVPPIRPGN